jgi:hypothetical protein
VRHGADGGNEYVRHGADGGDGDVGHDVEHEAEGGRWRACRPEADRNGRTEAGARRRGRRSGGERRPVAVAVVTALLTAATAVVTVTVAAQEPAAADHCGAITSGFRERDAGGGREIGVDAGRDDCDHDDPDGPDGPGNPGPASRRRPACPRWVFMGTSSDEDVDNDGQIDYPVASHVRPSTWDAAPVGASFYYDACTSPNGFRPGATTRWLPPGTAAPAPPSPEEVADALWLEIRDTLRDPAVEATPAVGEPAVVDIPTFVYVTNWQGEFSRSRCEVGVCVELTATPTLVFDPGEPGAEARQCDPPGTRFDPDPRAPSPDQQAAPPGACTHTYQRRTGVGDRPDVWTGVVSVPWDVEWAAPGTDASGEYDLTLSTDLPRDVDEVQTVVDDLG